jgi:4-hydroxythreonine-4-phosphate dehydrogenase
LAARRTPFHAMTTANKPTLAVTMGDPAGVGPEIIVGSWGDARIYTAARPVVFGHPEVLRRAAQLLGRDVEVCEINQIEALDNVRQDAQTIPCIRTSGDDVLDIQPGRVCGRAGEAAFRAVERAATLALQKKVDGIVTAPLSKAALHEAGHHYPGHTELLAEMCGVDDFAMMLYLPPCDAIRGPGGLGVVHVTLHQSLSSIFADLTTDAIYLKCRLIDGIMRRLGTPRPRLAVCALNPHAGEVGLFGDEERQIITPAVEWARSTGLDAEGPFPTDTLMLRARDGEFDAVVAMYHDQGHIALKLLGMHYAVNITLGLPIVRTSVAHGTAFDQAWKGTARCDGMVAAIVTAARLVRNRA